MYFLVNIHVNNQSTLYKVNGVAKGFLPSGLENQMPTCSNDSLITKSSNLEKGIQWTKNRYLGRVTSTIAT
jgi:hypothetical protein